MTNAQAAGELVEFPRRKKWTSAAEDAKTIRDAIRKRWGLSGRQVSVRAEEFSMGSAVRIVAKVPGVPLSAIEGLAQRVAETIHRDERTGEILGGGNRYVSANWDYELTRKIEQPLCQRFERLAVGRGFHPVPGFHVSRVAADRFHATMDGDFGAAGPLDYVEGAARRLGMHLLEKTASAVEIAEGIARGIIFTRLP